METKKCPFCSVPILDGWTYCNKRECWKAYYRSRRKPVYRERREVLCARGCGAKLLITKRHPIGRCEDCRKAHHAEYSRDYKAMRRAVHKST